MWEDLSAPWRACVAQAWDAWRAGSIPHGAAVAGADGRVLSVGRNRVHERDGDPGQLFGHKLAHAEMNALLAFSGRREGTATEFDREACALYATTEPCNACAGALLVAGLGGLRYASRDPHGGAADLVTANPRLRPRAVAVAGPHDARLELVLMGLRAEYWWRQPAGPPEALLRAWEEAVPAALRLGEELRQSRLLGDLSAADASAAEMLTAVAGRLPAAEPRDGLRSRD